ncbi:LADA_0D01420g1_1 [Lachancea dasiensis]|uniref:LADA_0D01420g1_1 n=1 Tax=Lachancea dasiensis TaxID=1072105 RepID=A0A1G4J4D5_9SACH|nr:LADA_0D01420g1_1 [Lachancea dasiensis]
MNSNQASYFHTLAHPLSLYENARLNIQFVVLSILYLAICFVLLGICASDFLCPTVSNISKDKRYRGILTGILLSWCNSSPDLFTNFMSWTSSNAAPLSVGEVLGSCGFILCVVQGAVFIVMGRANVQLEREQLHHIQRDLLFILAAMLMMFYVCLRNEITLLNCTLMVVLYLIYVGYKAGFWSKHHHLRPEIGTGSGPEMEEQEFSSESDQTWKFSILSAMDDGALYSELQKSLGANDETITLRTLRSDTSCAAYPSPRPLTAPGPISIDRPDASRTAVHSSPPSFEAYHDVEDIEQVSHIEGASRTSPIIYEQLLRKNLERWKNGLVYLLAPQLKDFRQKSNVTRIIAIVMVPFTALLRLTCPQHDKLLEETSVSPKKEAVGAKTLFLLIMQAICTPFCILSLLSVLVDFQINRYQLLTSSVVSCAMCACVLTFLWQVKVEARFSLNDTSFQDDRGFFRLRSLEQYLVLLLNSFGIFSCILWISTLANALVEVMVLYQRLTGVSDGVLGLTIFSWGNSISDLMSNVAMCKLHLRVNAHTNEQREELASRYFFISLSACFGGVLLNSLIGIGLSGFVANAMGAEGVDVNHLWILRTVHLGHSGIDFEFILSGAFILVQVLLLLVVFSGIRPVAEYLSSNLRNVGIILCCWWGLATLGNIVIETSGFSSAN